ncbi:MAG: hypothetical protein JXB88_08480 [Spirochaetales bacterium]|nr:hypothetical protein [Spirochaetales bacterium]
MNERIYRLGDYKIIESDTGILHWEAHSGVGMFRRGMCYLKGDILFINQTENQKQGFLKLEFLENFKTSAFWSKTRYFCINAEIFCCMNGKKVIREEKLHWMHEKKQVTNPEKISPYLHGSDIAELLKGHSFRLHKYMMTRKPDGDFVWSAHAGSNIIKSGPCFLLEDIAFLKPFRSSIKGMNRQQYIAGLEQLPEWRQTRYYTDKCFPEKCESVNRIIEEKKLWKGFLKSKNVETGNHGSDKGPLPSKTNQIVQSRELKDKTKQFFNHSKIIKTLTSILFVFIVSSIIIFLLINRRGHGERSYYKSDDYSHRIFRKH